MKKLIISLFIGLTLTSSVRCMVPEEHPAKAPSAPGMQMIKITTSDDQEFEIPREVARFSQTLENLIEDIGAEAPIPLPQVSSKEWETIYKIFVSPELNAVRLLNEVKKLLQALDLANLLSILNPIELLDTQMKDEHDKFVDIGEIISKITQEKIKADPDAAIKLMRSTAYQFPARFEAYIAQALLIAKKIIEPLQVVDTQGLGLINSVAWSSDGRLAIGGSDISGKDGMRIRQVDGTMIPVDTQGMRWISAVAWSIDGRLAIGGRDISGEDVVRIRQVDGTMIPIHAYHTQRLGRINSVAWSVDGRLAIGGQFGVRIRQVDGTMIRVDTQGLVDIEAVAWSVDGRLVIGDANGVRIRQADGTMTLLMLHGLRYITSVAWSLDGRLAIGGHNGARIRQVDGTMIPVDTQEMGSIGAVAWSVDGRLAIGGQDGMCIRQVDGTMIPVDTQGLVDIEAVAWSSDGRLAICGDMLGGGRPRIYYFPQEYQNLSVAQAFLIIKLATDPEATLTDNEKELYTTLDQKIKDRYSASAPATVGKPLTQQELLESLMALSTELSALRQGI